MRTTLDLPDDLFRQLKVRAATKGSTVKDLLTRFVERGLRQPDDTEAPTRRRSPLPVIKRGRGAIGNVTPQVQAGMDEDEDRAKLRRSFGR
ncbi:MAG: hypothetical protein ABMA15_20915 [Vicinamibacterales bacterium]